MENKTSKEDLFKVLDLTSVPGLKLKSVLQFSNEATARAIYFEMDPELAYYPDDEKQEIKTTFIREVLGFSNVQDFYCSI